MKSWLWKGMLGAVVALPALSGAAWAQSCSNATLNGEYAFAVTLYTSPPAPPTHVGEGVKFFDGQGGFTQFDYQGGTVPAEFRPPGGGIEKETGTYTVDPQGFPDCTGTLNIMMFSSNGAPTVEIDTLIVISDGGRHIHEVVSQVKVGGNVVPVQPEVSADDWKVESAQNAQ